MGRREAARWAAHRATDARAAQPPAAQAPGLPLAPLPGLAAGWGALQALLGRRGWLPALAALHAGVGDVFRLPLPNFSPVVLAGPRAARFVLVDERDSFGSRIDLDPIAHLLRQGVLVEDGAAHVALRGLITPALHRRLMERKMPLMAACADEVARGWPDGQPIELLPQMRRLALLVLTRTVLGTDIAPDLSRLWGAILRALDYIAPGAWLLWPGVPRPGYGRALRRLDEYLYRLIAERRAQQSPGDDLLGLLAGSGLSDGVIRDQLLTLLIAGHDTVTAALTWALYSLGRQPDLLAQAQAEVRAALGGQPPTVDDLGRLPFLERAIKETLRLYPPIHVASRLALRQVEFDGRRIPAGTRLLFSIFLTHRHPCHWPDPERFDPERFNRADPPAPFSYLPFGAGPRFCLGAALAQVETKVALARLLQTRDLTLISGEAGLRMRATLEPASPIWLRASV